MQKPPYALSVGTLLLLAIPIFVGLGDLPFRVWDEGRIALNTYEMLENKDFISLTFSGLPEFWNTKPILLHWLQGISITLLGFDEFSFRLPSAIAAFLTCWIVYRVGAKKFNSPVVGWIAAIFLVSFIGFVGEHSGRTGEYDALLALFTTLATLYFYKSVEEQSKYLLHFLAFIALAALTKGIAGLLFLPVLGLFALWRKAVVRLLLSKEFYIGLIVFIISVGGYYYAREINQPGYLEAVYMNELGGRFGETVEQHQGSLGFYFVTLKNGIHIIHLIILVATLYWGFTQRDLVRRRFYIFSFGLLIMFALILGMAGTKLDWYFVPIYPFVALMMALGSLEFHQRIIQPIMTSRKSLGVALTVVLISLIVIPYGSALDRNINPREKARITSRYGVGRYLQDCLHGREELNGVSPFWQEYDAHVRIYVILLQDQGHELRLNKMSDIKVGQKLIVSEDETIEFLDSNYESDVEQIDERTFIYTLLADAQ